MSRIPAGWFPKRGEVYWLRLDKDRPALVISNDSLNMHALDVCVVPITSVLHGRFALRVAIRAGDGGLVRESWAKCDQVTTLNKQSVAYPPIGRLPSATLKRIEDGIRLALDLT
jgi:mRNA interferase MazF